MGKVHCISSCVVCSPYFPIPVLLNTILNWESGTIGPVQKSVRKSLVRTRAAANRTIANDIVQIICTFGKQRGRDVYVFDATRAETRALYLRVLPDEFFIRRAEREDMNIHPLNQRSSFGPVCNPMYSMLN